MPIFSVIILLLLVFIMVRPNSFLRRYEDLFVLTCVLEIFWFQGYFFKVGNSDFSDMAHISSYLLMFYSLYLLYVKKINLKKRTFFAACFFVFIIALGMFYEIVNPYNGLLMPEQNEEIKWGNYIYGKSPMWHYVPPLSAYVRPFLEVVVFTVLILVFKQMYTPIWFAKTYMRIVGWLKYGIFYGYIEFVIKNIIGNLTITYEFATLFFGENVHSVLDEALMRGGTFYSLQGFTREPSHFNIFLFTVAMLMLLGNVLKQTLMDRDIPIRQTYGNKTFVLCIILMLITGGFSSVWFLFVIGCAAVIIQIQRSKQSLWSLFLHKKWTVFSFSILLGSVVVIIAQNDYLYNRLMDAFSVLDFLSSSNGVIGIAGMIKEGNDDIGSTIARFVSVYEGILIFIERPLLGISWHIQPLHDFSVMMLCNIGVLGFYALFKILGTSNQKIRYDVVLLLFVFLIGGFPITISPGGLQLYWVIFFEITTFYMNNEEYINVSA